MALVAHLKGKYMEKEFLGNTPDGKEIYSYIIKNNTGLSVKAMNFGAIVLEINVPFSDSEKPFDVALGFSEIKDYFDNDPCFGAIVGRSANRIGGAKFTLDGKEYSLSKNDNGKNNLHSGPDVFYKRIWNVKNYSSDSITFEIDSPDGDQGYPHALHMEVRYTVSEKALLIDYTGLSDGMTIFNPTYHGYFNLDGTKNCLSLSLQVFSDKITYADSESIPDGTFREVKGTPFDFNSPRELGLHIDDDYDELNFAGGYDHNFVLRKSEDLLSKKYSVISFENEFVHQNVYKAAVLSKASRSVSVYTDLPGIQIYAGNYIRDGINGKYGKTYTRRSGIAMESQYFPNAINIPEFPQPVIEGGVPTYHRTVYEFG